MEETIRKIAKEVYEEEHKSNPYRVTSVPFHLHNGIDSPRVFPVNFQGFPIRTVVPTDTPPNGTIVLFDDGMDRKLYAFISNVWYFVLLS